MMPSIQAKSSFSFLFIVIFAVALRETYGWGRLGHGLVARLAYSQLSKQASDWLKSIVPFFREEDFNAAGSWADDILHADTNPVDSSSWQWSKPFHYINTPEWTCNYNSARDCRGDICIEGALKNYSVRAVAAQLDVKQRREALLFIIHYVGNIHQPLHVGFAGDLGGNRVRGTFMNSQYTTNLHSVWDTSMISNRMTRDFGSNVDLYYEHLRRIMINQIPAANDNDIKQWISESLEHVCEHVYLDETNTRMTSSKNFRLGTVYLNRNIGIAEQRLAQAGRRLSALINKLFNDSRRQRRLSLRF